MSGQTNLVYLKSAYGKASASLSHEDGTVEVYMNLKPNTLPLDTMVKALNDAPGIDTLENFYASAQFFQNRTSYPLAVNSWEVDAFCAYMKPWLGDALIDFTLTECNRDLEKKANVKSALTVVLGHHST